MVCFLKDYCEHMIIDNKAKTEREKAKLDTSCWLSLKIQPELLGNQIYFCIFNEVVKVTKNRQ